MEYLSTMNVRSRLALGFSVILALMMLLTVLGIQKVNFIDRTLAVITDVNSVKLRYAINYRGSVHDRAIAIRDVAIARNLQEITSFEKTINELEAFYIVSENKMAEMLKSGVHFSNEELAILKRINDIQRHTMPLVKNILVEKKTMQPVTDTILDKVRPAFITWLNTINEFIDYQEAKNKVLTPEARIVAGGFQDLMIILSALSLAVSIFIGLLIEKSFRNSLGGEPKEIEAIVKKIAQGDLSSVALANGEETGVYREILTMVDSLKGIVENINASTIQLNASSVDMSESASSVSRSSESQMVQLEQTSTAMNEMTTTVVEVARNAQKASVAADQANNHSSEGIIVVDEMNSNISTLVDGITDVQQVMNQLENEIISISSIVEVISGISEQTNLLALNAAIEAARAGEQGRGFAVVADEVRSLANRTQDSTSEIQVMISSLQTESKNSVELMQVNVKNAQSTAEKSNKANEALEAIRHSISIIQDMNNQIATSAEEQTLVAGEINQSIVGINDISKVTFDSSEKNTRSSQELSNIATSLNKSIEFFKV